MGPARAHQPLQLGQGSRPLLQENWQVTNLGLERVAPGTGHPLRVQVPAQAGEVAHLAWPCLNSQRRLVCPKFNGDNYFRLLLR